jgi:hypothetical protein
MNSFIIKKVSDIISSAKRGCNDILKQRQQQTSFVGNIEDFVNGSKLGLDHCLGCSCLEDYEKFIIYFTHKENEILNEIKKEIDVNSFSEDIVLNKNKLKLLNFVKGVRCSIEYIYSFLVSEIESTEGETKQ